MAFSERGNAPRLKEADEWMKREPTFRLYLSEGELMRARDRA